VLSTAEPQPTTATRGRKAYFVASVTSQAAALLRYVLLARILGPVELGYAAMIILTSQFFESISDTGSDRFLVQDAEGDTPVMQKFVQLVMVSRGVLIAICLSLFAQPLAGVYKSPTLITSIMVLGVAPLIGGFIHLDIRRLQRSGDFWPESITTIVGELVGLVATISAAWWVRDHTAVVYGLIARAVAIVGVSHLVSQRRYGWAFARSQGMRFSRFAFPLFFNGLLLFGGGQGDRLIVGNRVGPAGLGHYSAILLLIYYPASTLSKFVGTTALPGVARAREDAGRMRDATERLAGRSILLAVGMAAGFAVVGPIATPILYGRLFAQGASIFALIGCVQSARFLRIWPTTIAVALGRSEIVLANNLARTVALPIAFFAAVKFHSLSAIVSGFMVGEIVALLAALVLLARTGAVTVASELTRVGTFLAVSAALVAGAWGFEHHRFGVLAAGALATLLALAWTAWEERLVVGETWRVLQREAGRYARRFA
jgi:O-antigen/teichoic acid export membrane protein